MWYSRQTAGNRCFVLPMTQKTEALLKRLEEIAHSIADSSDGLGLLAHGSVGDEREHLDDFFDLDFFAVVASGSKARFLNEL